MVSTRELANKQTLYHIRNTVKYCVKTGNLNGKILNDSELTITSLRAVRFGSLVHIRGKINLETSEYDILGKN